MQAAGVVGPPSSDAEQGRHDVIDGLDVRRDPWWDLARVVALVLVAVVTARLVGRLNNVLGLTLLACSTALVTAPVRSRLARWMPSGLATALTALLTFVGVVAVSALLVQGLAGEADRLAADLTSRVDSLQPDTLPARVAEAFDAQTSIDTVFSQLPSRVVAGESGPLGLGGRVVDLLLVVILAAFLQSSSGGMLDWIVGRWPREGRAAVRTFVADLLARGGGYVRRILLLALLAWPFAALAATALDLPGPVIVGGWLAFWVTVPWVGGWIGAAPLVALAASDSWTRGVLGALLAVAIVLAAGVVRRTRVERRTVEVGAAATAFAAAAGLAIGSFDGLLVCLTVVALARAWMTSKHELVRPTKVRTTMDDDAPANDGRFDDEPPRAIDAIVRTTPEGVRIAPGWRGAFTVLATVVVAVLAWSAVSALSPVAVWAVVAILIAMALHRPVSWLERRARVPRFVAIGAVCLAGLGIVAVATSLGVAGGVETSSQLSEELPDTVDDLARLPIIGRWLDDGDVSTWLEEQTENLPERLGSDRTLADFLPSVGARLIDAFWTLILAAAFLVDGPRIAAAVERRIPARSRRQAIRLRTVSHRAVGGYLAGAALVAFINALVVFGIALALGIVLAPVLALWAFAWNFVPQVGGFMGGMPLVVLALAQGPIQAMVALVLFVGYQFLENHLIQPAVISESIDVPAWIALLAALAGGAAAGLVGAVVLTPLVGVVRVIVLEVRRDDFPGTTVPLATVTDGGTAFT